MSSPRSSLAQNQPAWTTPQHPETGEEASENFTRTDSRRPAIDVLQTGEPINYDQNNQPTYHGPLTVIVQSQHAPNLSVVVKPIKISQKGLVIDRMSKRSLRTDSWFCIDEPSAFTDNMQAKTDYIPTEPTKPKSAVKILSIEGAWAHRNLRVFGSIKFNSKITNWLSQP